MASTADQGRDERSALDAAVTAFTLWIRTECPTAEVDASFARYEDEDAHIRVTAPPHLSPEQRESLSNQMAEKSLDILIEQGFLILPAIEDAR